MRLYLSLGSRRPMTAASLCLVLLLRGCISASGQPENVISKSKPVFEELPTQFSGLFSGILNAMKGVTAPAVDDSAETPSVRSPTKARGQELPKKSSFSEWGNLSLSKLEEMNAQALKDKCQGNNCIDCVDDGEGNMLPDRYRTSPSQ